MIPVIDSDGKVRIVSVREAQSITTSSMPELTLKGAYTWLRRGWENFKVTYPNFYATEPMEDSVVQFAQTGGMQVIPIQEEGMPMGAVGFGDVKLLSFRPIKRAGAMSITEEMMRFDKTTELRDKATKFGVAQRRTLETQTWDLVRTPGGSNTPSDNIPSIYQSASTVAAPWVNQASAFFGGSALYDGLQKMVLQSDPNGNPLGVNPDVMLIPFVALAPVKAVLESEWLGFTGTATAGGLNGVPTNNVYKGMISSDNIITSPFWKPMPGNAAFTAASFPWVIVDRGAGEGFTYLEVEPPQIIQENMDASTVGWFERGEIRIKAKLWGTPALRHPQYVYANFPVS